MSTLRDAISSVRSTNKFINGNDLINDRAIGAELSRRAILLIKRETNLRRLWSTDTIFQTVGCIAMKKVPISECCNYRSDRMVSRSIERLPRISEGIYGYLVQGIYDLDASVDIKYMNPQRFINRLKLKLLTNDVYFWISDGYIYLTAQNTKNIRIVAYFEEDIPYSLKFPTGCDCGEVAPTCPDNPLDLEFRCPGYLENQVIEMTSQFLRQTYLSTGDIKTDANEDTQKKQ